MYLKKQGYLKPTSLHSLEIEKATEDLLKIQPELKQRELNKKRTQLFLKKPVSTKGVHNHRFHRAEIYHLDDSMPYPYYMQHIYMFR